MAPRVVLPTIPAEAPGKIHLPAQVGSAVLRRRLPHQPAVGRSGAGQAEAGSTMLVGASMWWAAVPTNCPAGRVLVQTPAQIHLQEVSTPKSGDQPSRRGQHRRRMDAILP